MLLLFFHFLFSFQAISTLIAYKTLKTEKFITNAPGFSHGKWENAFAASVGHNFITFSFQLLSLGSFQNNFYSYSKYFMDTIYQFFSWKIHTQTLLIMLNVN